MDFTATSTVTHVYSIMALIIIMIFNYISVLRMQSFIPLAKRLRFMTPLYHTMNAFIIYTGAILAAYSKELSATVILMIATSIFIMVLEIKRYKKMRVIKSTDYEKQQEFVIYAKKIYTIEIIAVIVTYGIAKIF